MLRRYPLLAELLTNLLWGDHGRETLNNDAVAVDEKLREIPGDLVFAFLIRNRACEHFVELAGTVAVDLYLGKHWKLYLIIAGDKLQNFLFGAGLLGAKLIAGKAKYRQRVYLFM